MRTLTTEFLRESFKQETGIIPVFLMTISHDDLAEPIRVSSDPTMRLIETPSQIVYGTRSNGIDYLYFPFTLTLPGEGEDGPTPMKLGLDNVRREFTEALRSIVGPASIDVDLVTAGDPDSVVAQWPQYLLTEAKYDAETISATLQIELLYEEPYPALSFNPAYFPAIFRNV